MCAISFPEQKLLTGNCARAARPTALGVLVMSGMPFLADGFRWTGPG